MASGEPGAFGKLTSRVLSVGLNPESPRLTVGIWGPRGTGKTTSLAVLPLAAESTRWTMEPLDEAADGLIQLTQTAIVVQGRFPDPAPEREPIPYTFAVRRDRSYVEKVAGRRRNYQISLVDATGEWCERPIPARAAPDSPIEYLVPCDAILYFLDPTQMRLHGSDYGAGVAVMLDAFRHRLGLPSGGRLPHHIAFVVPRIDEDEQWRQRERVEAYVMEQVGMVAHHDIVARCQPSRFRFFAVSSVGRADGVSNCQLFEGRSRIANPAKLEPYRLFDPLEWILEGFS